ncbi:MAG: type II toxin-antitoxin system VapC family toxin [Allosphingosinicella sp.]
MRITADTNLLVRILTRDEPGQSKAAEKILAEAEIVALTLPTLCELVWVLTRGYEISAEQVSEAIRRLMAAGNVAAQRPAVEAGLAMLDAGGDFADGVIAFEGGGLGGETFVSFDRRAVQLLRAQGQAAEVLR